MVEAAQPPKTGETTVKRHGFGENHRKITPKMAKFQNSPKKNLFRDCVE
jgi:hypothetical protein